MKASLNLKSLLALIVFIAGLLYFIDSMKTTRSAAQKLASRQKVMQQLLETETTLAVDHRAAARFKSLRMENTSVLEELALESFSKGSMDIQEQDETVTPEGLAIHRSSVRLEKADLGEIGAFLNKAAESSPPGSWRPPAFVLKEMKKVREKLF